MVGQRSNNRDLCGRARVVENLGRIGIKKSYVNNYSCQAGFTLIEVMVASAIIMASLGVLLQIFGSGLDRLHRVDSQSHFLVAGYSIVTELEQVNPAQIRQGEGQIEGLHYRWEVQSQTPWRQAYDVEEAWHRKLALFDLRVVMTLPSGADFSFTCKRLGWTALSQ